MFPVQDISPALRIAYNTGAARGWRHMQQRRIAIVRYVFLAGSTSTRVRRAYRRHDPLAARRQPVCPRPPAHEPRFHRKPIVANNTCAFRQIKTHYVLTDQSDHAPISALGRGPREWPLCAADTDDGRRYATTAISARESIAACRQKSTSSTGSAVAQRHGAAVDLACDALAGDGGKFRQLFRRHAAIPRSYDDGGG